MEYISIGRIVNTHGIKGELKVESWSDFDEERYETGNRVFICHKGEYLPFTVKSFRFHKNHTLLMLEEIRDINDAEQYKTDEVCISADSREELPEGEYYQDELIGLQAADEDGNVLGEVIDVEETSYTQNRLRIRRDDGQEFLVPFVPAFIREVNFDGEVIVIRVMEGLL